MSDTLPEGTTLFSNDETTTVATLRKLMQTFVDERDWQQFHSPKNLSMSLAIEAAELMEHFQWLAPDESRQAKKDDGRLHAIGEELADVLCYALSLANSLDIDIATAVQKKMIKNSFKYPPEKFKGKHS